jgi:hypothetical protein
MIDYANRQRTPRKLVIGLTAVVVLHGLLFWAINSGLARKFVKVIKGPVEAVLLEEAKPDIAPAPPTATPTPTAQKFATATTCVRPSCGDSSGGTITGERHCGCVQHTASNCVPFAFARAKHSAACISAGTNCRSDQCCQLRETRLPKRLKALGGRRHCAAKVLGGR